MLINLFNYIMFIIVMDMYCDIVSYITCAIHCLCKILIVCGIKCIIILGYIVCIISVNGIMFITNNIISKLIICGLYIVRFVYLIVIKNISLLLINMFVHVICVIEYYIIIPVT